MDRLKISREKLAFLVDSTSAPVASLAVISSWIAAEVSFVANEFTRLGIDQNPFLTVVASLQYRYYPILMLAFVLIIALSQRDFGPMLKAEHSARR
jgi:Na+/H+ antiporter NhaC